MAARSAEPAPPASGSGPTGGGPAPRRDRGAGAKPWIVVGIIAVVAIVVSIFVLNLVRGGGSETNRSPEASTAAPTETSSPTTGAEDDTDKADDDDKEKKDDERNSDEPPEVEVGNTNTLPIGPWNATSELSQRFGSAYFSIPDNVNLTLTSDLLNSFPDSCADMRQEWGATKLDGGGYEVRKPAKTCEDAPELYDEVWGLTAAWVDTIESS